MKKTDITLEECLFVLKKLTYDNEPIYTDENDDLCCACCWNFSNRYHELIHSDDCPYKLAIDICNRYKEEQKDDR